MRWVPISFCIAAACVLATVFYGAATADSPCDSTPNWAAFRADSASDGVAPTVRQRTADQLIECHTLTGMPRSGLRRRLDKPDTGAAGGRRWRYVTGPTRDVPVDSEELVIDFRRDRVATVRLEDG